ncbi:MAG: DUF2829 domain-containing protein [Gammaproteobacteria bacterium]|nr:DUF2829 domain-containing protein [Gammaproteobacteria bacterium]
MNRRKLLKAAIAAPVVVATPVVASGDAVIVNHDVTFDETNHTCEIEYWAKRCFEAEEKHLEAVQKLNAYHGTFDWALIQMRKGKTVRRKCWQDTDPSIEMAVQFDRYGDYYEIYINEENGNPIFDFWHKDVSARDWIVVGGKDMGIGD